MRSARALVAACHSKACAPPPAGVGGSDKGPLASVAPLVSAIRKAGGQPFVVGGFVRDKLLGLDSKDIDIEVHGLSAEALASALAPLGKVDEVGKSFGVLKISVGGEDLDISLPRTDSKSGEGHTGFDVSVDPHMGIEKALSRRDFTINAIAMDPDTGEIIDPFGGAAHLQAGKLVAVSDAFSEDPLRVIRGIQFAGRFGMTMDDRTAEMSRSLLAEIETLPLERIWGEFEKIGTKGVDFDSLAKTVVQVGLQGRFGQLTPARPDLSGLVGDQRVAVALASLGVDPIRIGAPTSVTRRMTEIQNALAFRGDLAESRAFARTMKLSTFDDAQRIDRNLTFDSTVRFAATPSLVSGKDLVAVGVKPGPEMGRVLATTTAAQDRGDFLTKEEALRFAMLALKA